MSYIAVTKELSVRIFMAAEEDDFRTESGDKYISFTVIERLERGYSYQIKIL